MTLRRDAQIDATARRAMNSASALVEALRHEQGSIGHIRR
jgi:hypothetical protein